MNFTSTKVGLLLLLLTLFFQIPLTAQSYRWKSKLANSINLVTGGDLGFRLISGDKNDPKTVQAINNREHSEKQKLNYRFGIDYYHGTAL